MKTIFQIAALAALLLARTTAQADLIAYWDENSNALPAGGFGFLTTDFPQAADQGAGSLSLADFDATTHSTADGDVYDFVASFSGTTVNAQPAVSSGGSFSFVGDVNNGASVIFDVSTAGLQDIAVSWAQRGTSTGYTSRDFSYSTDGGTNYTSVGFSGDSGALTSTWGTATVDLSGTPSVDNLASLLLKITYDGATSGSGNNRWDNFTVEGTQIPEPASFVMLFGGLLALTTLHRARG
jgi:hypothetical protein